MRMPSATELTIPAIALAGGILYLVIGLIGGQVWFGIAGLVIMVVFAAVLWLVRRRSETVKGLLDRRDERINAIDLRATASTAGMLILALIVAFAVSVARGGSGQPYAWLLAVGGISYIVAVIILRIRG